DSRIVMSRLLDGLHPEMGILVGEVNASYLWGLGSEASLPPRTEMCVLEQSRTVMVCTFEGPVSFSAEIAFRMSNSAAAYLEWDRAGEPHLASFWSIPLKFRFRAPTWTVVLSEAKAQALAPMADFKYTFSLVVLLSLWIVSLLSVRQIRRSLVPLEELREGTRRIAMRDFANRVTITSGDEFEELGTSFNAMAGRLGRQFDTLATISDIDRAVLSALDSTKIIETVLARIPEVFPCDLVSVSLLDREVSDTAWIYLWDHNTRSTLVEGVELVASDAQRFQDNPHHLSITEPNVPKFIAPLSSRGMKAFLVFPLFRVNQLSGFIAMGYHEQPSYGQEDLSLARQLADQVAAALANADDVAERKRAEELLRDSNRQLKDALAELKTTQHQMVQQERLRALGQMASGIAHDFNNTLSPIVGFSELMLLNPKSLQDKEKVKEQLRIIHTAARDAAKVVSRLRDFYRPRVQNDLSTAINLNQLVEQAIKLTQPKWKDQALATGITVRVDTGLSEIQPVAGNESELREVLTNLIFNAVDAMVESGTISLRTRPDGTEVVLEVSDTGSGMTEEVKQRCLEPFYSTKGDRGTGLGLSMVYGIIRRHQGSIEIESELGRGTTFIIRLPIQTGGKLKSSQPGAHDIGRGLHVLVADDDPLVCRVTTEYLTTLGYTVETVSNGKAALESFQASRFDLVVTDQAMPGMSGDQVAAAIKKTSPATPVIMLTGIRKVTEAAAQVSGGADFIVTKPLTMKKLRDVLAKVKARETSYQLQRQGVGDHS
ncbi:MAG: response regulator, partial [Nitrospiraceae bacterium]